MHGPAASRDYLEAKNMFDQIDAQVVNIAVIGQARQGKSSLINNFLGEKVCRVWALGVTTTEVTRYTTPTKPNLVLWDLPGVDGNRFRREKYFEQINLEGNGYDFFLIVSKDIFSSDALFVAEKLRQQKKSFFFIRTGIDETIRAEFESNEDLSPRRRKASMLKMEQEIMSKLKAYKSEDFEAIESFKEEKEKIAREVRTNIERSLQEAGFDDVSVYLVNNFKPQKFDFAKLIQDITESHFLSHVAIAAFTVRVAAVNIAAIEAKYKHFRNQLNKTALICSLSSTFSVTLLPGASATVDATSGSGSTSIWLRSACDPLTLKTRLLLRIRRKRTWRNLSARTFGSATGSYAPLEVTNQEFQSWRLWRR